ncbi:hypothetical protein SFRURICE_008866 [Spodoptera frugiperda]|nr:hypothetical protein SFRURICE_008866 [Spodoptera frugiperda]
MRRFTRAERELQAARPFGYAPRKFYESSQLVLGPVDVKPDKTKKAGAAEPPPPTVAQPTPADKEKEKKMKRIYIAMTSDRGLCGGVHSGVARRIRRDFTERAADGTNHKLVCVGDKSRAILRRTYGQSMLISIKDVRTPFFTNRHTLLYILPND